MTCTRIKALKYSLRTKSFDKKKNNSNLVLWNFCFQLMFVTHRIERPFLVETLTSTLWNSILTILRFCHFKTENNFILIFFIQRSPNCLKCSLILHYIMFGAGRNCLTYGKNGWVKTRTSHQTENKISRYINEIKFYFQ